jgi:hypothetical protein
MGHKSSADEGLVHSPDQTRNTTEQTNKQRTATKNQNKRDIAGDLEPYSTLQKKIALQKVRLV